jgi:hypothetical protein
MNLKPPENLTLKKESFNEEFNVLLTNWKNKWIGPLTGPLHLRKSMYEQLRPESLEAQLPEIEARKAIIEYSTSVIKKAATVEDRIAIVENIKINLGFGLNGDMKTVAYDLMTDIFKNTLLKP